MGISGLLPLLKSIHKPTTLKKFAGQTIGIDAYGWLHRGTVACAIELATGKPTTKYVEFAMSRVRMLLDFGVTPYLVFDGDAIPSKAGTNAERRKRREESLAVGLELYKAGKVSQAHQELQKAAGVTPSMARQFIDELKRNNIQYVVAPYEADAQLAYLEKKGIINGVLSEDSDLLVFGVKRLLTKLNQYGECIEIERADFGQCKELSLAGWTDTMFRRMAILSGCDYLTNIPKMGLKTSYRYVRKYKDTERLLRMVALEGFLVPTGYLESFNNAELTFMHHRVFCPLEQRLVFLNPLAPGTREEDMPFLGENVESEIAIGVACGDLNPKTKEALHARTINGPPRPPLKDLRRQTLPAPSELKPSKSIDAFFKTYRQPLAELDPNSLTPSPSQQRVFNTNRNASWEPRLVSSAPQLRRAGTNFSTAPTPSHTDRRAFLAKAGQLSMYQPPKRQRLCSEPEISPNKEVKQSPFFASNDKPDEASPLARKKMNRKKSKKSEFDIFSDDSIPDEDLLALAEIQEFASPDTNVRYPTLGKDDLLHSSVTTSDSLETIPQSPPLRSLESDTSTQNVSKHLDTVITNTPPQNVPQDNSILLSHDDGDEIEKFEDIMEFYGREKDKMLSKCFVHQSPERRNSALASMSRSPPTQNEAFSQSSKPSVVGVQVKETATASMDITPPTFDVKSAHRESTSSSTTSTRLLRTFTYQEESKQRIALKSLGRTQSQEEKIEIAKVAITKSDAISKPVVPTRGTTSSLQRLGQQALDRKASPALSTPLKTGGEDQSALVNERRAEAPRTLTSKGSEDLLVPDSEEEDEEYVDAPQDLESSRRLDLSAFAFKGT